MTSSLPPRSPRPARMLGFLILYLFLNLFLLPATARADEPFVGMWVWKEQWINTAEERQKLIAFCTVHGITRLLMNIHFDWDESADPAAVSLRYPDELRDLLALGREAGVSIEALDGGRLIGPDEQARYMAKLDVIIAFNRTLPEDARFVGVHYDIEPHVTDVFKESYESRVPVMQNLLTFYAAANAKLRLEAPGMTLACDVPMWLDGRTEGDRSCMVEFMGTTKNLVNHIQDLTDYIGIMSYRRFAVGKNSVTYHVQNEMDYADGVGRGVCAGVETGRVTADPKESAVISFYGIPSDVFWSEVGRVHETFEGRPAYRGVLIHCYARFQEYLADNPPEGE